MLILRPPIAWVVFGNVRLGRGERLVSGGVLFGVRLSIGDCSAAVENGLHVGARLLVWRDAVIASHGAGPGVVGGQREHGPELVGESAQVGDAGVDVLSGVEGIGDAEVALRARINCIRPWAPAGDCAVARYADSTAMTACTRSGSTPCRSAATSTMSANGSVPASVGRARKPAATATSSRSRRQRRAKRAGGMASAQETTCAARARWGAAGRLTAQLVDDVVGWVPGRERARARPWAATTMSVTLSSPMPLGRPLRRGPG